MAAERVEALRGPGAGQGHPRATGWVRAVGGGLLAFGIVALLLAIAACTVVAIMLDAVLAVEWLR